MSDEPTLETQPQQDGQPDGQPDGQQQGAGQSQPEYVTKEQLDAFAEELKGSFEQAYRGVQSQSDRAVSRMQQVRDEVSIMLTDLRSRGVQISPEQEQQLSREIALDALLNQQQPPEQPGNVPGQEQPGEPGQDGDGPDEQLHWADAAAEELVSSFGFDIEETDPEYQELQKVVDSDNPMDFLDGYRQALTAKAERQQKTIPARMPNMGTGSSTPSNELDGIMDPNVLFQKAKEAGKI